MSVRLFEQKEGIVAKSILFLCVCVCGCLCVCLSELKVLKPTKKYIIDLRVG